jgi:hypothetical protein
VKKERVAGEFCVISARDSSTPFSPLCYGWRWKSYRSWLTDFRKVENESEKEYFGIIRKYLMLESCKESYVAFDLGYSKY